MATIPQKDVLIEYVTGTMIDIRKIGTEKDRLKLKILRSAIYSVKSEKINYEKTVNRIKKIREKYNLDDENKVKLKELKIFKNITYKIKDGWTNLIYDLGKDITELCESANCELPKILQVKEKYGTLRFYYDDRVYEYPEIIKKCMRMLVSRAENKSEKVCEVCGGKGELRAKMINKYTLWITTCDEHKEDSLTFEEWKEYQEFNKNRFAPEYSI